MTIRFPGVAAIDMVLKKRTKEQLYLSRGLVPQISRIEPQSPRSRERVCLALPALIIALVSPACRLDAGNYELFIDALGDLQMLSGACSLQRLRFEHKHSRFLTTLFTV
jgi:hypothetical protein